MSPEQSVVFVIDDDPSMRESLESLLRSVGHAAQAFGSTQEFLLSERPDMPGCLVLDVRLPGRSGLEFQRELTRSGVELPIVFISGHGDIPMSVTAMKAGAIEFLTKPFRDQDFRSEEHTSELQSLMRISYAVFCLIKKHNTTTKYNKVTE